MNTCKYCQNYFYSRYSNVEYCYNCICHAAAIHNHNIYIGTLENIFKAVGGNFLLYTSAAKYVSKYAINYDFIKSLYV